MSDIFIVPEEGLLLHARVSKNKASKRIKRVVLHNGLGLIIGSINLDRMGCILTK